jgi:putative transposase
LTGRGPRATVTSSPGPGEITLARLPRFDWPGALHHVMARGIERRAIFHDDRDRMDLLDRLRTVVPECGAVLYGWAFMPNHVHFIVRSGRVSVSLLMQRVETGYATRFNGRHERAGHLFQDRFRSRLVLGDDDLQNLIRYVHLNPIRAGIVADVGSLARWSWSGHGALMGLRAAWEFEDATSPLTLFAPDATPAREHLQRWMEAGVDSPPPVSTVDGEDRAPHDVATLIARACRHYGASPAELARGVRSERVSSARALICHVAVVRWRMSHASVAPWVGVSGAAVGQALKRGALLAEWDLRTIGDPREERYLVT